MFGPIYLSCKNKHFIKKFRPGMARFRSIRVPNPLSGEHILDVRLGMVSGSFGSNFRSRVSFVWSNGGSDHKFLPS